MHTAHGWKRSLAALAIALAFVAAGDGVAASKREPSTPRPATGTSGTGGAVNVASIDRSFVIMAASSGLLELEASRLAMERSKSVQVRTFAQRMIGDHAKVNDELGSIARTAGVAEVPTTMMPLHSAHLEKLGPLSGQEFDREYAAQIGVAAHTETVSLFEKASQDASNAQLKSFAGRMLPSLRDHLKDSQAMAKAVGVSTERMEAASAPPDLDLRGPSATPGR